MHTTAHKSQHGGIQCRVGTFVVLKLGFERVEGRFGVGGRGKEKGGHERLFGRELAGGVGSNLVDESTRSRPAMLFVAVELPFRIKTKLWDAPED